MATPRTVKPLLILLLGRPAAGKGTQSEFLLSKYGVTHLSTGDIFRSEISRKTKLGNAAQEYVNSGRLVPDSLVTEMVSNRLQAAGQFLLDGFPRNIDQANALNNLIAGTGFKRLALFLDIPDAVAIRRLTARRVCPSCGSIFNLESKPPRQEGKCDTCGATIIHRPDDSEEVAKLRLRTFDEATRPVIDFFQSQGILHSVAAAGSPSEVSKEISKIVDEAIAG